MNIKLLMQNSQYQIFNAKLANANRPLIKLLIRIVKINYHIEDLISNYEPNFNVKLLMQNCSNRSFSIQSINIKE